MANVKVSQRSSRWVLGFGADEEVIERARATMVRVFCSEAKHRTANGATEDSKGQI
jgi:hypothetical protein